MYHDLIIFIIALVQEDVSALTFLNSSYLIVCVRGEKNITCIIALNIVYEITVQVKIHTGFTGEEKETGGTGFIKRTALEKKR